MLSIGPQLLEFLEKYPRTSDHEFEGKLSHLDLDWKANGDHPDDVVELLFTKLKGAIPRDQYLNFAAQCVYRWIGKQKSELDMKETLFGFLETAFGTK